MSLDVFNETISDIGAAMVWDNITTHSNVTQALCVMCKYYLDPWVKSVRVIFGSCIVVANVATFVLLMRARSLQMALRCFLLNVSVVDCVYGAGFLYHSAIVDFPQFIVMNLECKLRYGILCMVSMVALFTLMAMCVERVIALKFAFTYHRLIRKSTLLVAIVFFWAIPLAIVTPTYILMDSGVGECNFVRFISDESFVVFAVTYFIFMVIAVICQLILFAITKMHIKKIIPTIVGDQKKNIAFKMNVKATSTTLALAVPFVICATPKVLTYMYLAFNPHERIKVESITMLAVTVYLNVSNSLINPLVYCWKLSELRRQILAMFRRAPTSPFTSSNPGGNGGSSKDNGCRNTESSKDESLTKGQEWTTDQHDLKKPNTSENNPYPASENKPCPKPDNESHIKAPVLYADYTGNEGGKVGLSSSPTPELIPVKEDHDDIMPVAMTKTEENREGYFDLKTPYNLLGDVGRKYQTPHDEAQSGQTNAWGLLL